MFLYLDDYTLYDQCNIDYYVFQKLWDCPLDVLMLESVDSFKENSLFVLNEKPFFRLIDGSANTNDNIKTNIKSLKNKSLLIIHNHKSVTDESFKTIKKFKFFIEDYNFEQKNVYFITQLKIDIKVIKEHLPYLNLYVQDRWLDEFFSKDVKILTPPKSITLPIKKFSIFCFRYDHLRFKVFCELLTNNLLDDFHYTFANSKNIPVEKIIENIPVNYTDSKNKIIEWVKNLPYKIFEIEKDGHYGQRISFNGVLYPYELRYYFKFSKIHIVLETEPYGKSYITEKTYKAIYNKKPFLLVSQKNALETLKAEGYKTFSPYINESYDNFDNIEDRVQEVIKEIIRLQNCTNDELNEIVKNCQEIVNYNYNKLFENSLMDISKECSFTKMLNFNHD